MLKLASGEWIGAWGLDRTKDTGSDAGRMQCVAQKDGDYYVLNGAKSWITHGKSGNVSNIANRELLDRGMTAFIVERGTQGLMLVEEKQVRNEGL